MNHMLLMQCGFIFILANTILIVIGKSGQVAQRFSSSLSSVGIPSQFVHAAEWGHGDLGMCIYKHNLEYEYNNIMCIAYFWLWVLVPFILFWC